MQNQKGITLIALVITIIVLLILAGVSISSLVGDNGVVTKAKDAAEKFNNSKALELKSLESIDSYIAMESRIPTTLWVGNVQGLNGQITLPIGLNDCSKEYLLEISSTLFNGKICLRVYGIGEEYIAYAGVDNVKNYMADIRHIYYSEDIETLFADEGVAAIKYESDGTNNILKYNAELLGSELTVTKIQSIEKEYKNFAKILAKWTILQEKIEYTDLVECIKFCIDSKLLGYEYLNKWLAVETGEENIFNESNEFAFLNEVYSNPEFFNTLEALVLDQAVTMYISATSKADIFAQKYLGISAKEMNDYTLLDYIAENEYLNEGYTRNLGASILPFLTLFDEELRESFNTGNQTFESLYDLAITPYFEDRGIAGLEYRMFADFYAIVGPKMDAVDNDKSKLPEMDRLKLTELYYALYPSEESTNDSTFGYFVTYAEGISQIVSSKRVGEFYAMIVLSGKELNTSGIRLGWNSLVLPETLAFEAGLVEEYDLLKDTEHIQKQGVEDIIDELYAHVQSVNATQE